MNKKYESSLDFMYHNFVYNSNKKDNIGKILERVNNGKPHLKELRNVSKSEFKRFLSCGSREG